MGPPLRLCVDTNCVLSGLANDAGACGRILAGHLIGLHVILITPEIVEEYRNALMYGAVGRLLESRRRSRQFALNSLADVILAADEIMLIGEAPPCRDEDDRKFLHCAVSGAADFVITRDGDLLDLHDVNGIPIVTPGDFLERCRANGWPLAR